MCIIFLMFIGTNLNLNHYKWRTSRVVYVSLIPIYKRIKSFEFNCFNIISVAGCEFDYLVVKESKLARHITPKNWNTIFPVYCVNMMLIYKN